MSKDGSEALVSLLKTEASDQLRSVLYFEEGDDRDRDVLYVRDDVRKQYTDEDVQDVFDELFFDTFGHSSQEDVFVHGELHCLVRFFSQGIELLFPHSDVAGTAVALDSNPVDDIEGLIQQCLTELYGQYPPEK